MSDTDSRLISGERIVFRTSKHWAALIIDSALPVGLVLASFVLAWIQPESTTGVLGFFNRAIELIRLGLFFTGLGWIVYNVVAWRTAECMVTNRRVLGNEGLLRRRSTDMLLTSVADIRTVSPALGRVLDYGHIRIISTGGGANDRYTALRRAEDLKRQVLEQKAGTAAINAARPAPSESVQSAAPVQPQATPDAREVLELLTELAKLRDAGVITADEYEPKKAELLRRI